MRESIGSALLLNIVIVFIGVISAFLIGSIAYSKAFKTKNRIISVIDEYNGVCNFDGYGSDVCTKKIEAELTDMGYSSNISQECKQIDNEYEESYSDGMKYLKAKLVYNGNGGHKYCVYRYEICDYTREGFQGNRGCKDSSSQYYYYKVVSFMHFDIPFIGSFLEFPVSGDSKSYIDSFAKVIN